MFPNLKIGDLVRVKSGRFANKPEVLNVCLLIVEEGSYDWVKCLMPNVVYDIIIGGKTYFMDFHTSDLEKM